MIEGLTILYKLAMILKSLKISDFSYKEGLVISHLKRKIKMLEQELKKLQEEVSQLRQDVWILKNKS